MYASIAFALKALQCVTTCTEPLNLQLHSHEISLTPTSFACTTQKLWFKLEPGPLKLVNPHSSRQGEDLSRGPFKTNTQH